MKPVHILVTASRYADVFLPLMLGEMNRNCSTPFRISLFLHDNKLQAQVSVMEKIFAQIDNPQLRKMLDGRIACFDIEHPCTEEVDVVLGHTFTDVGQLNCPSQMLILSQLPQLHELTQINEKHAAIFAPFEHIAHVQKAECAVNRQLQHQDIAHLTCFSDKDMLVISAKQTISNGSKEFAKGTELTRVPLSGTSLDLIPANLPSLNLVNRFLQSWQQASDSLVLCRSQDGSLQVQQVNFANGKLKIITI